MAEKLTAEHRETIQAALAAGVAAIAYILEPAHWPDFCTWADGRTGQSWGTQDRLAFRADMTILAMMGGLRDAPRNARQHPRR